MLNKETLTKAFDVYFDDAKKCRTTKAYWCLLHVTVCLPDVCCALESENGRATAKLYKNWCGKYFEKSILDSELRYEMRCRVLHQGRARADALSGGLSFAFGQPDASGTRDHLRIYDSTLHIDVGNLYDETRSAIGKWISKLESDPTSAEATNVEQYLKMLVRVSAQVVPVTLQTEHSRFGTINKTN